MFITKVGGLFGAPCFLIFDRGLRKGIQGSGCMRGAMRMYPQGSYLEGQGDLVSRLIVGISGVTMWFIGVIGILTKSP